MARKSAGTAVRMRDRSSQGFPIWEFPKIRGSLFVVMIIRIHPTI